MLQYAEDCGKEDEKQGNTSRRAVYGSAVGKGLHAVRYHIGVKGVCHHVRESRDDDQAEQPAEAQKQFPSGFSDVLFNQKSHGFSVVLHAGVQRAEVGHGSEEDTAKDNPQQYRKPSESGCLNGAGNRAGSGD